MAKVKKYLWWSQASLFGALLICCLIRPSVMIKNGGVSNFGNYFSTLVPYVLGFALSIVFLYLAAHVVLDVTEGLRVAAGLLFFLAFLSLLVFISTFPRHISWAYSDIHDYLGIALFSYEFLLSLWLVLNQKNIKALAILFFEAIGSIIGLLSILKFIHLLFVGQIIGMAGFSVILVVYFSSIIETRITRKEIP